MLKNENKKSIKAGRTTIRLSKEIKAQITCQNSFRETAKAHDLIKDLPARKNHFSRKRFDRAVRLGEITSESPGVEVSQTYNLTREVEVMQLERNLT